MDVGTMKSMDVEFIKSGGIVSIKWFWCIEIWWRCERMIKVWLRYEELMKVDWFDGASSGHWTRLHAKFLKLENGVMANSGTLPFTLYNMIISMGYFLWLIVKINIRIILCVYAYMWYQSHQYLIHVCLWLI